MQTVVEMDDVTLGAKVYVVDDDAATRAALDSILRSVGYQVELFETGPALLAHAGGDLPGCIVLDVRLPGPSGLEIQRRLSEMGVQTPVIFITGHGDIAMAVQAMKASAVEFLTKPFRDQDLLDAISHAMELDAERRIVSARKDDVLRKVASLSSRETEIFNLLCKGKLGKQIAHQLGLSEATVKVHRRSIMNKLGVLSLGQIVQVYGAYAKEAEEPAFTVADDGRDIDRRDFS